MATSMTCFEPARLPDEAGWPADEAGWPGELQLPFGPDADGIRAVA